MAATSTSWKPGQSGNPKGRARKGETWAEIAREVGAEALPGETRSRREAVIRKVYEMALSGDMKAVEFLAAREDGAPRQVMENASLEPIRLISFGECLPDDYEKDETRSLPGMAVWRQCAAADQP